MGRRRCAAARARAVRQLSVARAPQLRSSSATRTCTAALLADFDVERSPGGSLERLNALAHAGSSRGSRTGDAGRRRSPTRPRPRRAPAAPTAASRARARAAPTSARARARRRARVSRPPAGDAAVGGADLCGEQLCVHPRPLCVVHFTGPAAPRCPRRLSAGERAVARAARARHHRRGRRRRTRETARPRRRGTELRPPRLLPGRAPTHGEAGGYDALAELERRLTGGGARLVVGDGGAAATAAAARDGGGGGDGARRRLAPRREAPGTPRRWTTRARAVDSIARVHPACGRRGLARHRWHAPRRRCAPTLRASSAAPVDAAERRGAMMRARAAARRPGARGGRRVARSWVAPAPRPQRPAGASSHTQARACCSPGPKRLGPGPPASRA